MLPAPSRGVTQSAATSSITAPAHAGSANRATSGVTSPTLRKLQKYMRLTP